MDIQRKFYFALHPAGQVFAIAGKRGRVSLHDTSAGKKLAEFQNSSLFLTSVRFCGPNSNWIAVGGAGGQVTIWEIDTGRQVASLSRPSDPDSPKAMIYGLATSPDGKTLAVSGSDDKIMLWNMDSWTMERVLGGHGSVVWSVAFSPTGDHLSSGSADETVRVWNANDGQLVHTLTVHEKSKYVATRSYPDVVFSPDGKWLGTGCSDGCARIWTTADNYGSSTVVATHRDCAFSVGFMRQSRYLVSASAEGTVKVTKIGSPHDQWSHDFLSHSTSKYIDGAIMVMPDDSSVLLGFSDGHFEHWTMD